MPAHYAPDVVLVCQPDQVARLDVDQLNQVLDGAGLGTPLRSPTTRTDQLAALPVDGADPRTICAQVRQARNRGDDVPELYPDLMFKVGTEPAGYFAAGKLIGHGAGQWLPAPAHVMDPPPAWQPDPDREPKVIALLDTKVGDHAWIRETEQVFPPFVTSPYSWVAPEGLEEERAHGEDERPFAGHGTFIAGIVRAQAPAAQVLSVEVMSEQTGEVRLGNLLSALEWLADQHVDVVLMPFACEDSDAEEHAPLRAALAKLAKAKPKVRVVASAGNHGTDQPVYPAAFAVDEGKHPLNVVSVGARFSATERAPYSGYGPWVRAWDEGNYLASLMPQDQAPDGFAWWRGTSFAAARYAARLVNPGVA